MHPVLVGLSHKTAPIEIRECVAFRDEAVASALAALRRDYRLRESMILSTCNRVEILARGGDEEAVIDRIKDFLYCYHSLEPDSLDIAGVTEGEVEALALKYLLTRGNASGRDIAEQINGELLTLHEDLELLVRENEQLKNNLVGV